MFLGDDVGFGSRETVADFARVLSEYVDVIVVPREAHDTVVELAEYASCPVINGLTDYAHPCQAMADLFTLREIVGKLEGHDAGLDRRRQQRGAEPGGGLRQGWGCGSSMATPAGLPLRRGVPRAILAKEAAGRWILPSPTIRPRRCATRRRLHRRLDEHGPGGRGRAAAPRLRLLTRSTPR